MSLKACFKYPIGLSSPEIVGKGVPKAWCVWEEKGRFGDLTGWRVQCHLGLL